MRDRWLVPRPAGVALRRRPGGVPGVGRAAGQTSVHRPVVLRPMGRGAVGRRFPLARDLLDHRPQAGLEERSGDQMRDEWLEPSRSQVDLGPARPWICAVRECAS